MLNIELESELYKSAKEIARQQHSTVESVLNDALQQYVWEHHRRKISEESRLYREQHAALVKKYLGQYIAMQVGQVIDSDTDIGILNKRIRAKYGNQPILMTEVEAVAEPVLVKRGFRLEWNPE